MTIAWDTVEQLQAADELHTAIIEGITVGAGLVVVLVVLFLKKKYPKFTQKGFNELVLGFLVFSAHFVFDLLDTLVTKKIDGQTVIAYDIFDVLDAVLAFVGLFIIGFAFYRVAKFGGEVWASPGRSSQ